MATNQAQQRQLPCDLKAESAILSAMLFSPDIAEDALCELEPEDFFRPVNSIIFTALGEMFTAGIPLDNVSLMDYLRAQGNLNKAGGDQYIITLMGDYLAVGSWQHYAEILRRDSMLRKMIAASKGIEDMAYNAPVDGREAVEKAESLLLDVTEREVRNAYKTLSVCVDDATAEALAAYENGGIPMGVQTGFKTVDKTIMGMREGQFIVIGARPAVGKTSFALNLALNAARTGNSVAFFSLEMSGKEVAQRLICAGSGVPLSDFRMGKLDDAQWAEISRSSQELSQLDILIDDTPGNTVAEIRTKARRMLHGKEHGIVIIDYLQLMTPNTGRRSENRQVEVSEMSRNLKLMAKDMGVPVLALSQLSRQVESRTTRRPQLSDLRESGSIEQDADIVMFLDRSLDEFEAEREDRPNVGVTRLIIAKNRSGPTADVDLMFAGSTTTFMELAPDYIQP